MLFTRIFKNVIITPNPVFAEGFSLTPTQTRAIL